MPYLTPHFSNRLAQSLFLGVAISSIILVVFWPQGTPSDYFLWEQIPKVHLVVLSSVLFILSFIAYGCGTGNMSHFSNLEGIAINSQFAEVAFSFLGYTFPRFIVQTLINLTPFLPVIILSASLSGSFGWGFFQALVVVFLAVLLCHCFAFLTYLSLGGKRLWVLFINFCWFLAFFGLSALVLPMLNPILVINQLTSVHIPAMVFGIDPLSFFVINVLSLLLVVIALILVIKSKS